MPKVPRPPHGESQRHNPLAEDYSPSTPFREKTPKKRKQRHDDGEIENVVDTKASRKILNLGQHLVDEEEQALQARNLT